MKAKAIGKLFNVYIEASGVRYTLLESVSYHDARKFCEDNDWCFCDENSFVWNLDYEEC